MLHCDLFPITNKLFAGPAKCTARMACFFWQHQLGLKWANYNSNMDGCLRFVCISFFSNTGWWFQPLWKIWKSIGMMTFPTEWEKKSHVPVTTNQGIYYPYYPYISHISSIYHPYIIHILSIYHPYIIHILSIYYP